VAFEPFAGDHNDFAVLDFANELRADHIEGASL